jgi:hypothetical protein
MGGRVGRIVGHLQLGIPVTDTAISARKLRPPPSPSPLTVALLVGRDWPAITPGPNRSPAQSPRGFGLVAPIFFDPDLAHRDDTACLRRRGQGGERRTFFD